MIPWGLESIRLRFQTTPQRVVSLVPSYTESLFDLGFGETVVGITDYCVHPKGKLAHLPRVGGPLNPRMKDILALHPDLVIANQEENTRQTVEQLTDAGLAVWASFPKTVQEALDVLWGMVDLFHSREASLKVRFLEDSFDWSRQSGEGAQTIRYFCPIWSGVSAQQKIWWMTFNQDTYSHDLLSTFGGVNIFAGRQRRYPLEADLGLAEPEPAGQRDTRYPCVTPAEVLACDPQIIFLPSEPFNFDAEAAAELVECLAETTAVRNGRVYQVDGSLITWYGTRLGRSLEELPPFFSLST